MTARPPRIDELARAADGGERTAVLRRLLGECAASPRDTPARLRQIGAALGDGWPAPVLRALRGVVPGARPAMLAAFLRQVDARP